MWLAFGAIGLSICLSSHFEQFYIAYAGLFVTAIVYWVRTYLVKRRLLLVNRPTGIDGENNIASPSRKEHDRRRHMTYPQVFVPNSWYHLCDSSELKKGRVMEIRALGQTLVLWRASDGTAVCQDAFCLHIGANLAVGGKVVNDCIECPFHRWKFGKDGSVKEIPYLKNPKQCPTSQKLKTYKCIEWCGLVCIYFHADSEEPAFELPSWVPDQIEREKWTPHLKWDVGFYNCTVTDWVDQAGDHAHFHMVHDKFFLPYTLIALPDWLTYWLPIGICHDLTTYRGDDAEWPKKMKQLGMGVVNKHLLYFTDVAGLTWAGKVMPETKSETLEMYMGPAMVAFHVPFTIGKYIMLTVD